MRVNNVRMKISTVPSKMNCLLLHSKTRQFILLGTVYKSGNSNLVWCCDCNRQIDPSFIMASPASVYTLLGFLSF